MQTKVTNLTRHFNSTRADFNSSVEATPHAAPNPLKDLRSNLVALFDKVEREPVIPGLTRIDQLKESIAEYLIRSMSDEKRTSFFKEHGKEINLTLLDVASLDANLEESFSSL